MSGVRLDRRMVLEAPERVADGAGGFQLTWAVRGVLWAALKPGAGREAAGIEVRAGRCLTASRCARPLWDRRLGHGLRIGCAMGRGSSLFWR
jgi:hypothetical protein